MVYYGFLFRYSLSLMRGCIKNILSGIQAPAESWSLSKLEYYQFVGGKRTMKNCQRILGLDPDPGGYPSRRFPD